MRGKAETIYDKSRNLDPLKINFRPRKIEIRSCEKKPGVQLLIVSGGFAQDGRSLRFAEIQRLNAPDTLPYECLA